jgi:hypothetical protein
VQWRWTNFGAIATGIVVIAMGVAPFGGLWWARLAFVVVGLVVIWMGFIRVRVDAEGVHITKMGRTRTLVWNDTLVALGWQPEPTGRLLVVGCVVGRWKPVVLRPIRIRAKLDAHQVLTEMAALAPAGMVRDDDAEREPAGILPWWTNDPRARRDPRTS